MKRMYVSPQMSCEPSPSKVAMLIGSEHSYASTTDNAHSEVKQLNKAVKFKKKMFNDKRKKLKKWKSLRKA